MSEILDLAKNYERTLREQAKTTRSSVESALQEHESALLECLNAEQRKIESAISAHSKRMQKSLAASWMLSVIAILTTIGLGWAVIYWQGSEIANRYAELERLPKTSVTRCGDQKRLCVEIDPKASAYGEQGEYRILKGQ
ncbi:MbeB family mobilization protein [Providencia manganoxydans]